MFRQTQGKSVPRFSDLGHFFSFCSHWVSLSLQDWSPVKAESMVEVSSLFSHTVKFQHSLIHVSCLTQAFRFSETVTSCSGAVDAHMEDTAGFISLVPTQTLL